MFSGCMLGCDDALEHFSHDPARQETIWELWKLTSRKQRIAIKRFNDYARALGMPKGARQHALHGDILKCGFANEEKSLEWF